MSALIRHLPVVQNWDCHARGSCCKEYQITLSDEERRRIEEQGWDAKADLGGLAPIRRRGWWQRKYQLNHRADGSCVFLSAEGRCRIHERFGYEAKPLPCRLFPFVLIPVADHWRVGLRFACPSAAANLGRPLAGHDDALKAFAAELAVREGVTAAPDGSLAPPPPLQAGLRVDWPDLLRFVQALLALVQDRRDRLERRLRKCLALASLCRQAKNLGQLKGGRLSEFLELVGMSAEAEVPRRSEELSPPSWVGRVLFRQALALYTRKDQGPQRGPAARNRLALLRSAWRFARGRGAVPRLHRAVPETTFERVEAAAGRLPEEAEQALERYYAIKIGSLQFCGPAFFGAPFWDGLEALCLTFPAILWVSRALHDQPRPEAVLKALSIVDDHFGFNRALGSARQRLSFRLLAGRRELERLIAWYGR